MTKDATIKLRVSADEKANWEAQADADGVTLSSLIRRRMNHPTTRADGVLDAAPLPPRQGCPSNGKPCNCTGACMRPVGASFPSMWASASAAAPFVLSTTADSPGDRRSAQCEHGRPPYVFCPTCDQ